MKLTNKLEKLVEDNISDNNKEDCEKIIKYMHKIYKKRKNNDYTNTRDGIVFALVILSQALDVDGVMTTKSGRESLLKLKNDIINAFSLEEEQDV